MEGEIRNSTSPLFIITESERRNPSVLYPILFGGFFKRNIVFITRIAINLFYKIKMSLFRMFNLKPSSCPI